MNNYIQQLFFIITMSIMIIINLKIIIKCVKGREEILRNDISNCIKKAIEINQFIYINLNNFKDIIKDKIIPNIKKDILPTFKLSFKTGLIGYILWYFCCIIILSNKKKFFKFLELQCPILLKQAKIL